MAKLEPFVWEDKDGDIGKLRELDLDDEDESEAREAEAICAICRDEDDVLLYVTRQDVIQMISWLMNLLQATKEESDA